MIHGSCYEHYHLNPLSDDINLETQKIMLKQKDGSIRVLNATEIGDLEVLDSLGDSDIA